jgi:outer membrane protein TolC
MYSSKIKIVRRRCLRSFPRRTVLYLLCIFTLPERSVAQLSFASAIELALRHSPRVRAAQLDVQRAEAGLAIAKDIFIPSVTIGGGLGWSYGITLTVPTIFAVNAQSLIYSNEARFRIRAAHADIDAAHSALAEARQQVEEETAMAYINLEERQAILSVLMQQHEFARKLVTILEHRVKAGVDSEIALKRSQRGALEIELAQMQAADDCTSMAEHIAELTGLTGPEIAISAESIPSIPDAHVAPSSDGANPGILSAELNAKSKLERARGDAGYRWRPIITFSGQYGRVSPINDVSSYYNLHGNYNTANVGVQFLLPLFDRVREAAAQVSMADAIHAQIDVSHEKAEQANSRLKLQRSIRMAET